MKKTFWSWEPKTQLERREFGQFVLPQTTALPVITSLEHLRHHLQFKHKPFSDSFIWKNPLIEQKREQTGVISLSPFNIDWNHWLLRIFHARFTSPPKLYNILACEDAEYFKSQDEQRKGTQEKSTHLNHNLMEFCTFTSRLPVLLA